MSSKGHLIGGKFTNSHTTAIPVAAVVGRYLDRDVDVEKIAVGFITRLKGSRRTSKWKVKIVVESTSTLVVCTDRGGVQELRFYTKGERAQKVNLDLARYVRNNGWELRFGKHT